MKSTPTFFELLNIIVRAFHLEADDAELRSDGRFESYMRGRRIDRRDETAREFLHSFVRALQRSHIFPVLDALHAHSTPATDHHEQLESFVGSERLVADRGSSVEDLCVQGLLTFGERFERLYGEVRSQSAGDEVAAPFALLSEIRFLSHHMSIALGAMAHAKLLDLDALNGTSLGMSWAVECPMTTPLSAAAKAAGRSRAHVKEDPDGYKTKVDPKTIDNMWNAGDDLPDVKSIRDVIERLGRTKSEPLEEWRRWHGLRWIAQRCASQWGWEFVRGWITAMLGHAHEVHRTLGTSSIQAGDAAVLARTSLWSGWELPIWRWFSGQRAGHPADAGYGRDFAAIACGQESLRLQELVQIASAGPGVFDKFRAQGDDAVTARLNAVTFVWNLQGTPPPSGDDVVRAVLGLRAAQSAEDWQAVERLARFLVGRNPHISDNHLALVQALQMQRRWDEAFDVLRHAQVLHASDRNLRLVEIQLEIDRAGGKGRTDGFKRAVELLGSLPAKWRNWDSHLLAADAHFALGQWEACLSDCSEVVQRKRDCGEAFALGSLCHRKLGEARREQEWATKALRRGAAALLDRLRELDAQGQLGTAESAPIPRWHRFSD